MIVADFNLHNWTALDALEILKESGKDIPLIVVTGSLGDEAAVECIKQGAADFVLKDRPARGFRTAVPEGSERAASREERKHATQELSESEERYRPCSNATWRVFSAPPGMGASWNVIRQRPTFWVLHRPVICWIAAWRTFTIQTRIAPIS